MSTVEELAVVGKESRTVRGRLSSQTRRLRELDLATLSQPQVSRLQTAIQLITADIDEAEGITPATPGAGGCALCARHRAQREALPPRLPQGADWWASDQQTPRRHYTPSASPAGRNATPHPCHEREQDRPHAHHQHRCPARRRIGLQRTRLAPSPWQSGTALVVRTTSSTQQPGQRSPDGWQ